jgi:hypothetical protein
LADPGNATKTLRKFPRLARVRWKPGYNSAKVRFGSPVFLLFLRSRSRQKQSTSSSYSICGVLTSIERWKNTSGGKHLRDLDPASVRITLQKLGSFVPIDKEHYQRLCEVGTG